MITAPFNFVPLSDKVFFPDWADSVSHDIPFKMKRVELLTLLLRRRVLFLCVMVVTMIQSFVIIMESIIFLALL